MKTRTILPYLLAALLLLWGVGTAQADPDKIPGDRENVTLLGGWGEGPCHSTAVSGDLACFGNGRVVEILDVSLPHYPVRTGEVLLLGLVEDLFCHGDLILAAQGWSGMSIVDATDPTRPALAGSFTTGQYGYGVFAVGNTAYFATGADGLRILDITDPANPVEVGFYDSPGYAIDIFVDGSLAYLADDTNSLEIIDVSDPAAPTFVANHYTWGYAGDVTVSGGLAYVAATHYGLRIIDVTDPAHPADVGNFDTDGYAWKLALGGSLVYLADGLSGLAIIDVSTPSAPFLAAVHPTTERAKGIALNGDEAYLADRNFGCRVLDLTVPDAPVETTSYPTGNYAIGVALDGGMAYIADRGAGLYCLDVTDDSAPRVLDNLRLEGVNFIDVAVSGTHAYVADEAGLRVIDISAPGPLVAVGSVGTGGTTAAVAAGGSYAYVLSGATGGLHVVDVGDPTAPFVVGTFDTPGEAKDLVVQGGLAYIADGTAGLVIVDVSTPAAPALVGSYAPPGRAAGVAVADGYAYLGSGQDGLRVIDVGNPAAPVEVGHYDTAYHQFSRVQADGDYVFVADGSNGLKVFDVGVAAAPAQVGYYDTGDSAWDLAVAGNLIFLADNSDGLFILRNDLDLPDLLVEMAPRNPPVVIPAAGGSFRYDVRITNTTTWDVTADIALEAVRPGGSIYDVLRRRGVLFPAGSVTLRTNLVQDVPSFAPPGTYVYRLSVGQAGGLVTDRAEFTFEKSPVGVGAEEVRDWTLKNWDGQESADSPGIVLAAGPNPFNPRTVITLRLPEAAPVDLRLYDVAGRLVRVLVADEVLTEGPHEFVWDGRDDAGRRAASGAYFCLLRSGVVERSLRLVLVQ